MQTQILNRNDGERIVQSVKNGGAATISKGMLVAYIVAGASVDGISVLTAANTSTKGWLGIAEQDIPSNGYGLVCTRGLTASVMLSNVGTSITITAGDTLRNSPVAGMMFSSITDAAMTNLFYRYVISVDTATVSAISYVRGIVRA